jgi:REP-associated tyrosine transposase
MPRKPRIEVPGGYFHVTSRGVNGEAIAFEAADRTFWLNQLGRTVRRFDWVCVAFCMLSNHFHLVIQTPEPTLARGMEFLNGNYARGTNQRHGRQGHLFGRRYWSTLIASDRHLLETCRYVVLNPVRAGLCETPETWRWSSFAATVGLAPPPSFLAVGIQLGFFAPDPKQARTAYRAFVEDGHRAAERR